MEYISGGDLFFHVRKAKCFPLERARIYAAELLLAIEFMHGCGVIYRDLKPENVLIDSEGHVKIIDFGLSSFRERKVEGSLAYLEQSTVSRSSIFSNNIIGQFQFDAIQSMSGQRQSVDSHSQSPIRNFSQVHQKLEAATICGTPEYIAPEVILGRKYNQTVDFYGLGLLIFEMLSGYNPYKVQDFGGNTNMMFEMIVNDQVQFNFPKKNFSAESKNIIQQLMAKDPRKRLGSGRDGVQDIKQHPFFAGIDWYAVENKEIEVPFKPQLQSDVDTKYVDKEFLRQSKKDLKEF